MFAKSTDPPVKTPADPVPTFESLFNVCRIAIRFSGILGIDSVLSKSSGKIRDLKIFYYFFGICPVAVVLICEVRNMIHFWGSNISVALEICTSALSGLVVITQGFSIYYSRRDFLDFISSISDLWRRQVNYNSNRDIVRRVKGTRSFTQIYAILVILLASSYTLRPFCLLLVHVIFTRNETYDLTQTAYPALYPFAIDSMSKYITCISIEFLIFISVGAWWIAADMLFLQSATHLSSQYQILNNDLMTIKTGVDAPTISDSSTIQQLNSLGKRHAHLLLLSEKLKRLFSPILMCLMLVTSANICICIINLQEELIRQNIAGVNKCVIHTLITMIQPAIYCIYANDLVESAEWTAMAAYESDWVNESQNFKKSVRLITMRAQEGLKFRFWGFFNVDVHQLTQIGTLAVRFFALVNNLA
ncbi:odorant receptor 94a-like isoform X1 [Diachasmimorpha longicaudata]|uniref:odorant receptor 94a-like isoform X1 n=1 Tax=Diachasmimorpha longicaudata TaxID=58733 RepID=UPI0030B8775A